MATIIKIFQYSDKKYLKCGTLQAMVAMVVCYIKLLRNDGAIPFRDTSSLLTCFTKNKIGTKLRSICDYFRSFSFGIILGRSS